MRKLHIYQNIPHETIIGFKMPAGYDGIFSDMSAEKMSVMVCVPLKGD
jgi:hypothetical protein